MKRALVLGGAGFIGLHVSRRLLAEGCQVTAYTSSIAGKAHALALQHPHFTLTEHDIAQPFTAEADEIYHLASPASPTACRVHPEKIAAANIEGSKNVLTLAEKTGASVLFTSTSEIYGNPAATPQSETTTGSFDASGPRALYIATKRQAEALFLEHRQRHGTRVKIARLFNTYGPQMDLHDGRVLSNFILQALRGDPITLYGGGTQRRCFCYIDDMVDGLIALMRSPDPVTGPVNLGNPATAVTMQELATEVLTVTGSPSCITQKPGAGSFIDLLPDISLARSVLGWSPRTGLRLGLERTIAYARGAVD